MAIQTIDFYSIRTLTNLHAGSGDTTYGIVDNMVQRDQASGVPVIHSSSLKGALRQYYREANGGGDSAAPDEVSIFGSDTSPRSKSQNDFSAGSHLFFEARLLVLPVRSDRKQFFRAICPELVQDIIDSWTTFGYSPNEKTRNAFEFIAGKTVQEKPQILLKNIETRGFTIENWDFSDQDIPAVGKSDVENLQQAEDIFGENLLLINIDDFKERCKKLPVIARNQLENGISQNLFYEEVVPRESRFFSFIMRPSEKNMLDTKTPWLDLGNKRVQIGANATIGYGQCIFQRHASGPKTKNPNS